MNTIDIVARLRLLARGALFDAVPVVNEAADTIDRLRNLVAELELRVAEDDARWSQITIRAADSDAHNKDRS
jgi:hypothetical protein